MWFSSKPLKHELFLKEKRLSSTKLKKNTPSVGFLQTIMPTKLILAASGFINSHLQIFSSYWTSLILETILFPSQGCVKEILNIFMLNRSSYFLFALHVCSQWSFYSLKLGWSRQDNKAGGSTKILLLFEDFDV